MKYREKKKEKQQKRSQKLLRVTAHVYYMLLRHCGVPCIWLTFFLKFQVFVSIKSQETFRKKFNLSSLSSQNFFSITDAKRPNHQKVILEAKKWTFWGEASARSLRILYTYIEQDTITFKYLYAKNPCLICLVRITYFSHIIMEIYSLASVVGDTVIAENLRRHPVISVAMSSTIT